MKEKELTTDECLELFKKYDPELYRHYTQGGMWYFGYNARNYARHLKEKMDGG